MVSSEEIVRALEADNNSGFCRKCGEEHSECEPDVRNRKCEACGEFEVFGAEELLIMGHGTMAPEWPKGSVGWMSQRMHECRTGKPISQENRNWLKKRSSANVEKPAPKPRPIRGMTFRELSRNAPARFSPERVAELARRSGIATDCHCAVRLSPKEFKALPEKPARFSELDEVRESMVLQAQKFVEVRREKIVVLNRDSVTLKDIGNARNPNVHIVTFVSDGETVSHEVDLRLILTCERLAFGQEFHWSTCSAEVPAKRKNGKPTRTTHKDQIAMLDDKDNCQAVVMLIAKDE